MKGTNENMKMKARTFPPSDAQDVDLYPAKRKIKVKAKKTRLASLNIGTLKDCKVIPGEDIAAQHKLLVMDLHITNKSIQNKTKLEQCIKWGRLKTDAFAINANIKTIDSSQVSEKMWTDLLSKLIDTAKSTLGLTKGGNKSCKEL
ncbi:uncharacterized protein LOC135926827 [Gordionus sp. m RMFG-2023]|uniref:uncharacterized protein LOC135926827 n=1 Tax=Gordionus sp. m RMFG-2023 TaxID=3053472 RepID=UPI0031FD5B2B